MLMPKDPIKSKGSHQDHTAGRTSPHLQQKHTKLVNLLQPTRPRDLTERNKEDKMIGYRLWEPSLFQPAGLENLQRPAPASADCSLPHSLPSPARKTTRLPLLRDSNNDAEQQFCQQRARRRTEEREKTNKRKIKVGLGYQLSLWLLAETRRSRWSSSTRRRRTED